MPVINKHDFPPLPSQNARNRLKQSNDAATNPKCSRSKGSSATLNDLPDELILEILNYLPGIDMNHFQLPTLLNLSLTSRRLHRMVIEKVHANYHSLFCEPYLFLRTIIANPQVAAMVRNVNITSVSEAHRDRERYIPTAQDKKIIKEGMRVLNIPNWKYLVTSCNAPDADLEILHAAILMHLPNITTLTLGTTCSLNFSGSGWLDLIDKTTRGTSFRRMHKFEHLRSLDVDADGLAFIQLVPVFRVQSLRQIRLRELVAFGGVNRRPYAPALRLAKRCNNLEELHLDHSFFHMDFLDILVASARSLRTFKYDVALECLPTKYEAHHELGNSKLSTVLSSQKASLESLHVHCDARAEEETRGGINLFEGLAGFVALKRLSCPLSTVIDTRLGTSTPFFEILPPSLREFHTMVRRYTNDKDCLSALEHMAAYHCIDASQLKELRVVAPPPAPWFTYDWEPLVRSFSKTGISFLVEQEQDDEDGFSEQWDNNSTDSSHSSDEVDLYSHED